MAADLVQELSAFKQFVEHQLNGSDLSLEESVSRFREHQRQLGDLRQKLEVAEQQSARGESGPLDIDETVSKVRERLAEEGIKD